METNAEADSLKRVFGLPTLVVYGVGDILGAGIYAVIGKIAGLSGALVWVSFLTAMVVAALTALSYAELGSRFPHIALIFNLVLITFASQESHILALVFTGVGILLVLLRNAFSRKRKTSSYSDPK